MSNLKRIFLLTVLIMIFAASIPGTPLRAQSVLDKPYPVKHLWIDSSKIARHPNSPNSNPRLPSERTAVCLSTSATLIPITAAIIIIKLQEPDHIIEYDSHGYLTRDYFKDPDRTIPVALIISGVIIGPSIGYFYGDCSGRAISGIALRMFVGTATCLIANAAANSGSHDEFLDFSGLSKAIAIGSIGSAIIVLSAVYDLTRIRSTIKNHNEKASAAAISLNPIIFAHGALFGLQLTAHF